jgi:xylulokinase
MLPYFEPEIVPNMLEPGIRRFDLQEDDPAGNCRAVVEAQMMSMRIHSAWMRVSPVAIYATGGGSVNREILQIMADVHECPVHRFEVTNSAALGAALRAVHGYLIDVGEEIEWASVVEGLAEPVAGSIVEPNRATAGVYAELMKKYRMCEERVTSRA